MHIKSISEIESFQYRTLFYQFALLSVGLALLIAMVIVSKTCPTLKLWFKIPAVAVLSASACVGLYRFIWQIRYRKLLLAQFGDEVDVDCLPKIIGWCKWSNKYRDWETVHGGDHGAYVALINEIRKRKYKFGGTYHQQGEFGCPVMEDKTVYLMTQRAWGDVMADVWGGDYCAYAWGGDMGKVPDEAAIPDEKTEEDIRKENDAKEKARKEFEEYNAKRKEEKEKKDADNSKAIRSYLNSLAREYRDDAPGLVKRLRADLPGIMERVKDFSHGNDYKWVLNEKERARVAKAAERKRKEWLKKWEEDCKERFGDDWNKQDEPMNDQSEDSNNE